MEYTFANGVRVNRAHLGKWQIERYRKTGLHEPHEERLFLDILERMPRGVFFDIGAGIGYYAILAKKKYPDLVVHAFEPFPVHRQCIIENVELNKLPKGAINIYPTGIADAPSVQTFCVDGYASGLARDRVSGIEAPTIDVKITTLDHLLAKNSIQADLVKMDIQGSELAALHGAARSIEQGRIKRWIVGTHSDKLHADCLAFLRDRGYTIAFESLVVPDQPDGIIYARL